MTSKINGLLVDETGLLQLNLPIATYSTLGGVIIGEGLVVDENGLISLLVELLILD